MDKKNILLFALIMMVFVYGITYAEDENVSTSDGVINEIIEASAESADSVPTPTGITLNAEKIELYIGDQIPLTAVVLPERSIQEVNWMSSNEAIATVSNGMVYGVTPGNVQITAATVDGGYKAVCDVTVKDILISGLSFNFQELKGFAGETLEVPYATLTLMPENATDRRIKWETDSDLVDIDAESNTDKIVLTLKGAGTAEITVKSEADSTVFTMFSVIIEEPTVETSEDETTEETPVDEPTLESSADKPTEEIPADEPTLESSADEPTEEIPVDETTPEPAVDEPTEEIPVDEPTPEPVVDEPTEALPTEETAVPISWFSINQEELKIYIGETKTIQVYFYPEDASSIPLKWTVSDPSIATINSKTNEITGLSAGSIIVRAESMDGVLYAETRATINDLPVDTKAIENGQTFCGYEPEDNTGKKSTSCSSVDCMESTHPVDASFTDNWFYFSNSENVLRVTFDTKTVLNNTDDRIYVRARRPKLGTYITYCMPGSPYQLSELSGTTVYLPDGMFSIGLSTDANGQEWGFKITDITEIPMVLNSAVVSSEANKQFTLNWQSMPEAEGYKIVWAGPSSGGTFSNELIVGKTTSSLVSVSEYGTYQFKIAPIFYKGKGDYEVVSGFSAPISAAIKANINPPTMNTPTVYSTSNKYFRLSWSAVSGATGYRIWRSSTSASSGYNWTATVGNTTGTISSVPAAGTYYYKVAAIADGQVGAISVPKSGLMITAVAAPTMNTPTIYNATNMQFRLSWSAVSGATGYKIWRSSTSASSGYNWTATVGNVTAVNGTSVPAYGTYWYKVAAIVNGKVGLISQPKPGTITSGTVYRALIIGEAHYTLNGASDLPGSAVSAAQAQAVFQAFNDNGKEYSKVIKVDDRTHAQVLNLISSTFAGADGDDVSLFYFIGHGMGGTSSESYNDNALCAVNSCQLSAVVLRSALDNIPGKKIVIADTCYSGGLIEKNNNYVERDVSQAELDKFALDFIRQFYSSDGNTEEKTGLNTSGYYVMTAVTKRQYGWSNSMYGHIFSQALMDGLGSGLDADRNGDTKVTFGEAYNYAKNRTAVLINSCSNCTTMSPQVYPVNSSLLFYTK